MNYKDQILAFSNRLSKEKELKQRYAVLTELCDSIENFLAAAEYAFFLEKFVPAFLEILDQIPISNESQSGEHKLRNITLELLHRMVVNDFFKPYVTKVYEKLVQIAENDNEDNGILSIKIMINIHKTYSDMPGKVDPFIAMVNKIYENVMNKFKNGDFVHTPKSSEHHVDIEQSATPMEQGSTQTTLHPSMYSLKTLAECPINIVSLLSTYKSLVNTILPQFLPQLMNLLQLAPQPVISDLVLAQVKGASFLAYIFIRDYYPKFVAKFCPQVPDIVVRLLKDCPSELSSARKELLHAVRHILSTSYKQLFLPKLDVFLDKKVLLGDSFAACETLKPLAYSTAADFLHNIRHNLSSKQVWKSVFMYSKLLQDTTLAPAVQIMSGKLLSNLMDRINKLPQHEARALSFVIITAYLERFRTLNSRFPCLYKEHLKYKSEIKEVPKLENNSKLPWNPFEPGTADITVSNDEELNVVNIVERELNNPVDLKSETKETVSSPAEIELDVYSSLFDIKTQFPLKLSAPSSTDPLKDARLLFKTLLNFLKSVITSLRVSNPNPPFPDYNSQIWGSLARDFSSNEVDVLSDLFRETIKALRMFQNQDKVAEKHKSFDIRSPNLPITASKDEKEIMELIATIYMKIELPTFNEICQENICFLVNEIMNNATLLHLPQFFLGNEMTSANFMGVTIKFLKEKLDILGGDKNLEKEIEKEESQQTMKTGHTPKEEQNLEQKKEQEQKQEQEQDNVQVKESEQEQEQNKEQEQEQEKQKEQVKSEEAKEASAVTVAETEAQENAPKADEEKMEVDAEEQHDQEKDGNEGKDVEMPDLKTEEKDVIEEQSNSSESKQPTEREATEKTDASPTSKSQPKSGDEEQKAKIAKDTKPAVAYTEKIAKTFGKEQTVTEASSAYKIHIFLRLFKLCLLSLSLYPTSNEPVLVPHVSDIVLKSLSLSSRASDPTVYFYLLRTLFKTVGSGRHPTIYNVFQPLAQKLLSTLNTLIDCARTLQERDVYIELCLTIPVKLTKLLPLLHLMTKPLTLSLSGSSDLVELGLKNLETFVDKLHPNYLEPLIGPMADELLEGLFKQLKPLPHSHISSHTVVRILGKMGGRSRKFVDIKGKIRPIDELSTRVEANFEVIGSEPYFASISVTTGVESAVKILEDPRHPVDSKTMLHYRINAFDYVKSVLKLLLNVKQNQNVKKPQFTEFVALQDIDQLLHREKLSQRLLEAIFSSVQIQELSQRATEFVSNLCTHFVHLYRLKDVAASGAAARKFSVTDGEGQMCLSEQVFLKAIVAALGSLNKDVRTLGFTALNSLHKISLSFVGYDKQKWLQTELAKSMAFLIIHSCHSEKYDRKLGAVLALHAMIHQMKIPCKWFSANDLVRALFFVIRDSPAELPVAAAVTAKDLAAFYISEIAVDLDITHSDDLVSLLVYDLASQQENVRIAAQKCLRTFAQKREVSVAEFIKPCRSVLLSPIFSKPLRALPFAMQIGNIDAVCFWVKETGVKDAESTFSEEIWRLLNEVLHLVNADDSDLVGHSRSIDWETKEQLSQIRVKCLQFLELFVNHDDSKGTKMPIFTTLFKSLLLEDQRVIAAAAKALGTGLADNSKLPRTLLQPGLKPMLMNLSDHTKLTVANLDALAKLLVLLHNYFKVEIGNKLFDHLNALAPLHQLEIFSGQDVAEKNSLQIACSILHIFHLLPPKAHVFTPQILGVLDKLEKGLRRRKNSPFRAPVARFVDKFPKEVFEFYKSNFGKNLDKIGYFVSHCPNFMDVVKSDLGSLFELDAFHGNKLSNILSICWELLEQGEMINFDILQKSFELLKDSNSKSEENVEQVDILQVSHANNTFQKLCVAHLTHSSNYEFSLQVLDYCYANELPVVEELQSLVFESTKNSKNLEFCLKKVLNPDTLLKSKVQLMENILDPAIFCEVQKGNVSVSGWLKVFHTQVWKSTSEMIMGTKASEYDHIKIHLLQITSMLIENAKDHMEPLRKDIAKFCWTLIKVEDIVVKHCAYLTCCYFIAAFATPKRIRSHMLVVLLRANNNDTRHLVKNALDLLAPAIDEPDMWLKYPRRVLSENGYVPNNSYTVYKFIVDHKEIFYKTHETFVSSIVGAMGKLTLSFNTSSEFQTLAIELAETVLWWEERKQTDKDETNYRVPAPQKEAFVTFLIRYCCVSTQTNLQQRALAVLYKLLTPQFWPDVPIKLSFFDRFLPKNEISGKVMDYCLNALKVLGICLEHTPSEWILENLADLQELLTKCIKSDSYKIQNALQRVLRIILNTIKNETSDNAEFEPEEIKNFLNLLTNTISDDLATSSSVAAGVTLCWTLGSYKPERLTSLLQNIIKTFGKLCRDHISNVKQSEEESKMNTQLLEKLVCFGAASISLLGEQRRVYLSFLAQLIEKTTNIQLLYRMQAIICEFVFNKANMFPTSKSKAAILGKMMGYELRKEIPSELTRNFYKIILKIFEDESFRFSDLTQRLEQPFLIGTRFAEVGIRKRFMSILSNTIEKSADKRLYYVIKEQNWEHLADYPWIMQATEILLGSFVEDCVLNVSGYKFADLGAEVAEETNEELMDVDGENDHVDAQLKAYQKFASEPVTAKEILKPLIEILHNEPLQANKTWIEVFPELFKSLPKSAKLDFSKQFTLLLTRNYHLKQSFRENNVVVALYQGAAKCQDLDIPPHVTKLLANNFGTYFDSINNLEHVMVENSNQSVREAAESALSEVLVKLGAQDEFYGLWKKHARYSLTKTALAYEQLGKYDEALKYYEQAQIKARTGYMEYTDSEYALWEDNWLICAQKLQHWDVLTDVAKHENYTDLLLECGWRATQWNEDKNALEAAVRSVSSVPTVRRKMFESFLALQRFAHQETGLQDVSKVLDESFQVAVAKWSMLASGINKCEMMHVFQQLVEFSEATYMYEQLMNSNPQNNDAKTAELNKLLVAWRERLPNDWEDLLVWNDLVTQRLHFYNLLGSIQRPFLNGGNGNAQSQYSSRGYHETAFMINRFAHVARIQKLPSVCVGELKRIYSLPNIETSEAAVKLAEQAECHLSNKVDWENGLKVLSNTNMMYFTPSQKAQFFVLRGRFQEKLENVTEAQSFYTAAIKTDATCAEAWEYFGYFNYKLSKSHANKSPYGPETQKYASLALKCFFNASGLFKNHKSRKLLSLSLWLMGLDYGTEFEQYNGEIPIWYWITFVPQLLTALSHREARGACKILILIAKQYPQALHYSLKTTREDLAAIRMKQEKEKTRLELKKTIAQKVEKDEGKKGEKDEEKKVEKDEEKKAESEEEKKSEKVVDKDVKEEKAESTDKAEKTEDTEQKESKGNQSEKKEEDKDKDEEGKQSDEKASEIKSNEEQKMEDADLETKRENSKDKDHDGNSKDTEIKEEMSEKDKKEDSGEKDTKADTKPKSEPGETNQKANTEKSVQVKQPGNKEDDAKPKTKKEQTNTEKPENKAPQPWDYAEEISLMSKTSWPLLALSMELIVDQITQRFKSSADEDAYRLVAALLNDGFSHFQRLAQQQKEPQLPPQLVSNITKFAGTVLPKYLRSDFEQDLIHSKPNFIQYIEKLILWRRRLACKLDHRPRDVSLHSLCPHLVDFHHSKFEDVEVPGQYLGVASGNRQFVKIQRFMPTLTLSRNYSSCCKNLAIRGSDGVIYTFAVQYPANRHSRREERILQLFKLLGKSLGNNFAVRSRGIKFSVPNVVPLSPHVRILEAEPSDTTLHDVYEQFCAAKTMGLEQPFFETLNADSGKEEALNKIMQTLVPKTVLKDYVMHHYSDFENFWTFRKSFSSQYAIQVFMALLMSITGRQPHKIAFNVASGKVWTTEMLPNKTSNLNWQELINGTVYQQNQQIARKSPLLHNQEPVLFRLTPNIEHLMGEISLEGVFASHLLILLRGILGTENDLEYHLTLFVRDEITSWFAQMRTNITPQLLREIVKLNVGMINVKTEKLADIKGVEPGKSIKELIGNATSTKNLAQMDSLWRPYL